MANPEERTDDRPELPTRIPFAGPHPGTVERDWRSPVPRTKSPSGATGQRSRTSLPRAVGVPRQRSILADGSGPSPAVAERSGPDAPAAGPSQASPAEPGPAKRAATAEPAKRVVAAEPAGPATADGAGRALRSRILPVAVAASILVAGALWWSQDPAAPSVPQLAPAPTAAPTMRITAPGADASAGVGSDTASTKSASDAGATSGGPASSGGSPAAGRPAKSAKPSPNGAAGATGAAVNTSGRNLALGARATASTIEGGHWAAANAIDGDLATRWSSQFSDPQWLMVDLGKRWEISEILLHWENAHATAYRVEVSADGKKWKQVYSTTQGQGGDVTVPVPKTPTKLVRMSGTKRSTDYGYSLLDVEVR